MAVLLLLPFALYSLGNYVVSRFSTVKDNDDVDDVQETSIVSTHVTKVGTMSKETNECTNLKRRFSTESLPEEFKPKITFNPPAYIQRYLAVQEVLSDPKYDGGKLKKVVDFGCSQLGLLIYLKTIVGIEEVFFVDVDKFILETHSVKAKPLHMDYLHRRKTPLTFHVLEGSVNHHDKLLENVDAVVCIELIEHLYPDDLINFPFSVFGFIRPKLVIVTTPNADFNVLFNMTGFRHWDHKFEWTRSQFEDWAKNITLRYPEYTVTFNGIAYGPQGTEHFGACSQMAIFHKVFDYKLSKIPGFEGLLKTVCSYEYPFEIDNRTDEQKILEEAVYYIRKFSINDERYDEEVPIRCITNMLKCPTSGDDLREILENNNWCIQDREDGPVILVPPPTEYTDNSINEDNFLDNIDNDDEPGPPTNYYTRRNEEHHDINDEEDWECETIYTSTKNIKNKSSDDKSDEDSWAEVIRYARNRLVEEHASDSNIINIENKSPDGEHVAWEDIPKDENNVLDGDNDNSEEYANTTSSIFADDINLDDLETESHSSEIANSPKDESILRSSFSEIRDLENSEIIRNSCQLTQNSLSTSSNALESSNDSILSSDFHTSTLLVETSQINVQSEDLSNSIVVSVSSSIEDASNTKIKLENDTVTKNINETTHTSSLYVPSSKKIRFDSQETELLDSYNNAVCTNGLSNDVHESNDLSSCSNQISEYFSQINKFGIPENAKHYTGTIPKPCKRKILDIEANAQASTKLEKISPDTPGSAALSYSPEVMDSGYPNSTSPPNLSPEHDLSSIAQDNTSDSESRSVEDVHRVVLFEIEAQNRDLDNNNLDGEGNNLEAEEDLNVNDLHPMINVLENDLENENDIYDARNGFPAWLLRIQ